MGGFYSILAANGHWGGGICNRGFPIALPILLAPSGCGDEIKPRISHRRFPERSGRAKRPKCPAREAELKRRTSNFGIRSGSTDEHRSTSALPPKVGRGSGKN